jgi:hypothetical protein
MRSALKFSQHSTCLTWSTSTSNGISRKLGESKHCAHILVLLHVASCHINLEIVLLQCSGMIVSCKY